jgi:hypothetical protein
MLSARGALAAAPASIPNTAVRILPVIAVNPQVYTLDCLTFDSETQNDSTGNDYIVLTATTSGNIQSRLSREEVAHLTAQTRGKTE